MSNLQVRILSAIVLGAVVLAITWLGGFAFRLLAAAIGAAVYYEWTTITATPPGARLLGGGMLALSLLALVLGYPAATVLGMLALFLIVGFAEAKVSGRAQWTTAGLAYAGFSALSLGLLRGGDQAGLAAILFLFAVVWATDILAYFVGRAVGGPKLAPSISPGKTWSGAVGGAVSGALAGLAIALWLAPGHVTSLTAIGILLSVVSQAGDLFESWVKRRQGVKDSGSLIPGHGGVMDRVDGLVAAALALYLIGWLTAGLDNPAQGLFAN